MFEIRPLERIKAHLMLTNLFHKIVPLVR